jgi:hypothetical protein
MRNVAVPPEYAVKNTTSIVALSLLLVSTADAKESRFPNYPATQAKGHGRSFDDCLTIAKLRGLRMPADRNKPQGLVGRCMRGEPI